MWEKRSSGSLEANKGTRGVSFLDMARAALPQWAVAPMWCRFSEIALVPPLGAGG